MPAELKTLLADLSAVLKTRIDAAKDDDAKADARAEFLDEVKEHVPEVYQAIHNSAATGARGEESKRTAKVQKRLEAAETELAQVREKLEEAEKAKPDIAAATSKLQAQVDRLKADLTARETEYSAKERGRTLSDALAAIERGLIEGGMRPRAAKGEVLRLKEDGHVKLTEDGEVEFYQFRDRTNTYPTPKAGDQPWSGLVKDAVKHADPLDMASRVDRGGGTTRSGGASGAPGAGRMAGENQIVRTRDETGAETEIVITPDLLAQKKKLALGAF